MSFAYLDAGTGSIIATVVVGGTAAAGVAVRSAKARMTSVLSRKNRDAPSEGPPTSEGSASGAAPSGA